MKADFFAALWNVVNWPDVAARLDAAKGLSLTSAGSPGRTVGSPGRGQRQVLLAHAPGGVAFEVGVEQGAPQVSHCP